MFLSSKYRPNLQRRTFSKQIIALSTSILHFPAGGLGYCYSWRRATLDWCLLHRFVAVPGILGRQLLRDGLATTVSGRGLPLWSGRMTWYYTILHHDIPIRQRTLWTPIYWNTLRLGWAIFLLLLMLIVKWYESTSIKLCNSFEFQHVQGWVTRNTMKMYSKVVKTWLFLICDSNTFSQPSPHHW